jgi:hypothetical protein
VWLDVDGFTFGEPTKSKAPGQKETSSHPDLNEGPVDLQSTALTPELRELIDHGVRFLDVLKPQHCSQCT